MLLKTSRRTFLKGLTLSGVAGSLGVWSFNARSSLSLPVAASLQGTQFDLTIGETAVNITGSERQAKTINGGLPGPVLRWKEGDTITLKVKNRLNEQTSIHWHGIILPANMDGVPGLSFMGIEPVYAVAAGGGPAAGGDAWPGSAAPFSAAGPAAGGERNARYGSRRRADPAGA